MNLGNYHDLEKQPSRPCHSENGDYDSKRYETKDISPKLTIFIALYETGNGNIMVLDSTGVSVSFFFFVNSLRYAISDTIIESIFTMT